MLSAFNSFNKRCIFSISVFWLAHHYAKCMMCDQSASFVSNRCWEKKILLVVAHRHVNFLLPFSFFFFFFFFFFLLQISWLQILHCTPSFPQLLLMTKQNMWISAYHQNQPTPLLKKLSQWFHIQNQYFYRIMSCQVKQPPPLFLTVVTLATQGHRHHHLYRVECLT